MTDLTAVCERHGITLKPHAGGWSAWDQSGAWSAFNDTKADAVCALLKARYGIETRQHPFQWSAWPPVARVLAMTEQEIGAHVPVYTGQSELAAVVSLADHMRGAA